MKIRESRKLKQWRLSSKYGAKLVGVCVFTVPSCGYFNTDCLGTKRKALKEARKYGIRLK